MNETMKALADKAGRTACAAADTAADVAYGAGRAARRLLSVSKLNLCIADLQGQIDQKLQEAGMMLYATHTGDPTGSDELLDKLQEIDGLYARIDELHRQIDRLKGQAVLCPACAGEVRRGDVFCRSCGIKL